MNEQLSLFSPVRGMVRNPDHSTSVEAAEKLAGGLSVLQRKVLLAFKLNGPMTDQELERLPEFAEFGPSTIRKRRSELLQSLQLVADGVKLNDHGVKMKVWRVA